MFAFHEKRRIKSFLFSKGALLVLAILVAFLASASWGVYQKERETTVVRKQKEAELGALQQRESELREELDRLGTEHGIEAEIRSKFEVARDGEGVIVVIDEDEEDQTAASIKAPGFWQRLFGWF